MPSSATRPPADCGSSSPVGSESTRRSLTLSPDPRSLSTTTARSPASSSAPSTPRRTPTPRSSTTDGQRLFFFLTVARRFDRKAPPSCETSGASIGAGPWTRGSVCASDQPTPHEGQSPVRPLSATGLFRFPAGPPLPRPRVGPWAGPAGGRPWATLAKPAPRARSAAPARSGWPCGSRWTPSGGTVQRVNRGRSVVSGRRRWASACQISAAAARGGRPAAGPLAWIFARPHFRPLAPRNASGVPGGH